MMMSTPNSIPEQRVPLGVSAGMASAAVNSCEGLKVRRLLPRLPNVRWPAQRVVHALPAAITRWADGLSLATFIAHTVPGHEQTHAMRQLCAVCLRRVHGELRESRLLLEELERLEAQIRLAYPTAVVEVRALLATGQDAAAREALALEYVAWVSNLNRETANDAALTPAASRKMTETTPTVLSIDTIKVEPGRLERVGDVTWLMDSICAVGLLEPIVVAHDGELVAGAHRLKACRRLGWNQVPVHVVDLRGLRKRLAVLDENLVRKTLNDLEYGEQLAEAKQLYEALYPEARQHVSGGRASGARRTSEPNSLVRSYVEEMSRKTGLKKRTLQHFVQIAGISKDARDVVRGTELATKKNELIAIARIPPDKQRTVAEAVTRGDVPGVKDAVAALHQKATSTAVGAGYALTQGPRIAKLRKDVERLYRETKAVGDEWEGHQEMRPALGRLAPLLTWLEEGVTALRQFPIPAASCSCAGAPDCTTCEGRGWISEPDQDGVAEAPATSRGDQGDPA